MPGLPRRPLPPTAPRPRLFSPGLVLPTRLPAPRPRRVKRSNSVVLDGTGYGFCTVYTPSGVTALMVSYSFSTTQTDQTIAPPQFTSYLDSAPNISHFFESSGSGNRGSSDTTHEFLGAEPITGEWRAGTAGSIATFSVVFMQTEVPR